LYYFFKRKKNIYFYNQCQSLVFDVKRKYENKIPSMRWRRFISFLPLLAFFTLFITDLQAQNAASVFVDDSGLMRWRENQEEVQGFGVNYSAPFAHAFRTARRRNVPITEAIDNDIYHFARLGLDAYRVHVWDTEISDTLGNLLENEHLRLFDYLIMKAKERGIKFFITPIAYWGNGWPERDEPTPGFSAKYGKGDCLTDPAAIKAQENYLFQFLNHVNVYTGIAYKDDPDIIAFEVSNEPHHRGSPERVKAFINRMVAAMRKTGCQKPVFYNISHAVQMADAYFDADIQGGTFQWYPSGLVSNAELKGNFLPNVDHYDIPYAGDPRFKKMAKVVYEFDAADIGRSYIYPAIARSFRTAGIQWATHFAYDPTYMADINTEYGTHYMNLAYTPQKALSLKIASRVFHKIPMHADFGSYPGNADFGDFHLSYEEDRAEMRGLKEFIYTNHTDQKPPEPESLESISGWGHSPLVQYRGTGAYFLDRLEPGVWRLEVMPDAIWVKDPFGRISPKKKVGVIKWNQWPMKVDLPDLGENFSLRPINSGNTHKPDVNQQTFAIRPGAYLLTREGVRPSMRPDAEWKNIRINEFSAPRENVDQLYVVHHPVKETGAGEKLTLSAKVVLPEVMPESVELFYQGRGYWQQRIIMEHQGGYDYTATIPDSMMREGFLNYRLVVRSKDKVVTYPEQIPSHPWDWDFYGDDPYRLRVVTDNTPLYLFEASTDADRLHRRWIRGSGFLLPTEYPDKARLEVNVDQLFRVDPENPDAEPVYDYTMRYAFADKIAGREEDLGKKLRLIFRGRSLNDKPCPFQIALVDVRGNAYGALVELKPDQDEYVLDLNDFKKVKLVTMPRPYPTFLPYYFEGGTDEPLDLKKVEALQLSIGPGIDESELKEKHGVLIESLRLE